MPLPARWKKKIKKNYTVSGPGPGPHVRLRRRSAGWAGSSLRTLETVTGARARVGLRDDKYQLGAWSAWLFASIGPRNTPLSVRGGSAWRNKSDIARLTAQASRKLTTVPVPVSQEFPRRRRAGARRPTLSIADVNLRTPRRRAPLHASFPAGCVPSAKDRRAGQETRPGLSAPASASHKGRMTFSTPRSVRSLPRKPPPTADPAAVQPSTTTPAGAKSGGTRFHWRRFLIAGERRGGC